MDQRLKSMETVLVIVTGLLALFLWLQNPWLLRAALAVGLAGVFSPWLAQKIHAGWSLLAQGLGWFNGRVLLSLIFFLILTPMAWLARKSGAVNLQLRRKSAEEGSYYAERNHRYEAKDLEDTW